MCVWYSLQNVEYLISDLFFDSSIMTFIVIHQWIFGIVYAIFVLMAQGRMHYSITHDDAEGLVFLNLVLIYILYQTEQIISVICPSNYPVTYFYIIIGILLSPDWTSFCYKTIKTIGIGLAVSYRWVIHNASELFQFISSKDDKGLF